MARTSPSDQQAGASGQTSGDTGSQSSEERTRVQQASGFQNNSQNMPVSGEEAEAEGGTVSARPPHAVDEQQPPSNQPT